MDAKTAIFVVNGIHKNKSINIPSQQECSEIVDFIAVQEKHAELGRLVTEKIDQCSKNVITCYAQICAVKELCYKHKDKIDNDK